MQCKKNHFFPIFFFTKKEKNTCRGFFDKNLADDHTHKSAMMICVYVVAGDEERESTQFTTGAAGHAESGGSIPGGEDHQQQNLGADELPDTEESNQGSSLQMSCPLCSEKFPSQDRLESHAMSVHSVNSEGLQRLQSLINGSHWLNKKSEGIKLNHFVPNHLIGYRYYYYYCLMSLELNHRIELL